MSPPRTLLAVLAHPDDEVTVAGTLLVQKARGDRVVVLWLTRGEMTQAFGPLEPEEVAARRTELGRRAGELLDVETRFLSLPDTGVVASPDAAGKVARVLAELRPDGMITWGEAWVRGMRHPDHRNTGLVARDAITLARIAKVVEPLEPHRSDCPVFTIRGAHSTLPTVAVDVTPHRDTIFELAALYRRELGFGDPDWLEERLRSAGDRWRVEAAEELDAWETEGGLVSALLSAAPGDYLRHPSRSSGPGRTG